MVLLHYVLEHPSIDMSMKFVLGSP